MQRGERGDGERVGGGQCGKVSAAPPTDTRRQLIEHRRAQAIEPAVPLAGLDPWTELAPEIAYRRVRWSGGQWAVVRTVGGSEDRLAVRWQRPDEAYAWDSDLGIRMLARDLISDAIGLSPAERLPAHLSDRQLLTRFAAVLEHQLGDGEWTISADHVKRWLREQGFLD